MERYETGIGDPARHKYGHLLDYGVVHGAGGSRTWMGRDHRVVLWHTRLAVYQQSLVALCLIYSEGRADFASQPSLAARPCASSGASTAPSIAA